MHFKTFFVFVFTDLCGKFEFVGSVTLQPGEIHDKVKSFESEMVKCQSIFFICISKEEKSSNKQERHVVSIEDLSESFLHVLQAAEKHHLKTLFLGTSLLKPVISGEDVIKSVVHAAFRHAGDERRVTERKKIIVCSKENEVETFADVADRMFRQRKGCRRTSGIVTLTPIKSKSLIRESLNQVCCKL